MGSEISPETSIIPTVLRCVVNHKSHNIRKGHCFRNSLITYRSRRRQLGCGQTYSKIWLPKFSIVKKETVLGATLCEKPLCFWLCDPAFYIYIYIYIYVCVCVCVCVCVYIYIYIYICIYTQLKVAAYSVQQMSAISLSVLVDFTWFSGENDGANNLAL